MNPVLLFNPKLYFFVFNGIEFTLDSYLKTSQNKLIDILNINSTNPIINNCFIMTVTSENSSQNIISTKSGLSLLYLYQSALKGRSVVFRKSTNFSSYFLKKNSKVSFVLTTLRKFG